MNAISTSLGSITDTRTAETAAVISLSDLTSELTSALDRAFWAFEFQGEVEDALDSALLRTALADTPTLSGGLIAGMAA